MKIAKPAERSRIRLGIRFQEDLSFRRTYCSWAHDKGVPEKIVAELMGHSNVRTTLNIYTQVLQDSVKIAVSRIGEELFTLVHSGERAKGLST
jgi:integrase